MYIYHNWIYQVGRIVKCKFTITLQLLWWGSNDLHIIIIMKMEVRIMSHHYLCSIYRYAEDNWYVYFARKSFASLLSYTSLLQVTYRCILIVCFKRTKMRKLNHFYWPVHVEGPITTNLSWYIFPYYFWLRLLFGKTFYSIKNVETPYTHDAALHYAFLSWITL